MLVPSRHENSSSYRYGFQGQELDNEIKGEGNSINYTFRMHDPRVGRFFAVDPLTAKYPHNSPYAFSENRVIDGVELEGLERYYYSIGKFAGQIGYSNEIRVVNFEYIMSSGAILSNPFTDSSKKLKELSIFSKESNELYKNSKPLSETNDMIIKNVAFEIFNDQFKGKYKLGIIDVKSSSENIAMSMSTDGTWDWTVYKSWNYFNNYYDFSATLLHESYHGRGYKGDSFTHFDIQMNVENSGIFKMTTKEYQQESKSLLRGYLFNDGQEGSLLRLLNSTVDLSNAYKILNSKDFKILEDRYKKNIERFNKHFNEDNKPINFEEHIKKFYAIKKN